jgi:hypothetical protein
LSCSFLAVLNKLGKEQLKEKGEPGQSPLFHLVSPRSKELALHQKGVRPKGVTAFSFTVSLEQFEKKPVNHLCSPNRSTSSTLVFPLWCFHFGVSTLVFPLWCFHFGVSTLVEGLVSPD